MSLARAVGRNTIIQIIGKVIGTVLGLMTVALIQRSLGSSAFGAYTIVMTFTGFFSVIADLGLYLIVLREIAKPGADEAKIIGNALTLRIVAAVIILGVGAASAMLFPYSAEIKQGIWLVSLSFFFIAVQQVLVSMFQKALRMLPVTIAELAGRVVLLAVVLYFAQSNASLWEILYAVVASTFINALIIVVSARRITAFRLQWDPVMVRYIFGESWPIAISIVLNLLYFRLDTIFLSLFRSNQEVGLYGASYKILEILITFPNIFVALVVPTLSASARIDWSRFKAVFQRTFELLLIAAVPVCVGGFVLAEQIVVFIGGAEYAGAAPFFRILIFSVACLFLGALSGNAVTAINEQRKMVWRYLAVATLGIVAYLTLIPWLGGYGAAIGNLLAEAAIMVAGFHMVWKSARVLPSAIALPKILLAGAGMLLVCFALRPQHVLLALTAGMVVYVALIFALRVLHVSVIREILSKNQPTNPIA